MLSLISIRSRYISKVFEYPSHQPSHTAPRSLSRSLYSTKSTHHLKMATQHPIKTHVVDVRGAEDRAFETAVSLIQAGELVAFPTETVYGLGANALDAAATAKVCQWEPTNCIFWREMPIANFLFLLPDLPSQEPPQRQSSDRTR